MSSQELPLKHMPEQSNLLLSLAMAPISQGRGWGFTVNNPHSSGTQNTVFFLSLVFILSPLQPVNKQICAHVFGESYSLSQDEACTVGITIAPTSPGRERQVLGNIFKKTRIWRGDIRSPAFRDWRQIGPFWRHLTKIVAEKLCFWPNCRVFCFFWRHLWEVDSCHCKNILQVCLWNLLPFGQTTYRTIDRAELAPTDFSCMIDLPHQEPPPETTDPIFSNNRTITPSTSRTITTRKPSEW